MSFYGESPQNEAATLTLACWLVTLLPPATKLGQGCVFTRVCDTVRVGGCMLGYTDPPGPEAGTPRDQAPPQHSAYWEIRATSGWYASYWNAIFKKFSAEWRPQNYYKTIIMFPLNTGICIEWRTQWLRLLLFLENKYNLNIQIIIKVNNKIKFNIHSCACSKTLTPGLRDLGFVFSQCCDLSFHQKDVESKWNALFEWCHFQTHFSLLNCCFVQREFLGFVHTVKSREKTMPPTNTGVGSRKHGHMHTWMES